MLRDLFSLFPAYAGVILPLIVGILELCAFPRIRGGDPMDQTKELAKYFFSPHTRG